jgi:hypothetical protein
MFVGMHIAVWKYRIKSFVLLEIFSFPLTLLVLQLLWTRTVPLNRLFLIYSHGEEK